MIKLKRKYLEKACALVLAAVLSTLVPANVFAAENDIIDTSKPASLTIYKYDETAARKAGVSFDGFTADGKRNESAETKLAKYAISGVEFTYLKVSDIKMTTEGNVISLAYTIPTGLETALGLTKSSHTYSSTELSSALATALTNNTSTKNKLEDYIKSSGGTKMAKTDASGKTTKSSMGQGLYLVVETQVPKAVNTTVNPFFVSLPMTDSTGDNWFYDVFAYPKNQTNLPTIDKVVSENGTFDDTATASEGDVVKFRLVSKLPKITSKATYLEKYTFTDKISGALAYNKDVTVELYDNEKDAKQGTGTALTKWSKTSAYFATTYADSDKTMTVSLTPSGLSLVCPGQSEKYIVVCYSATLDSSSKVVLGDKGNPNDVGLTYKRTSEQEETIKDRALVYSYGLDLSKKFQGKTGDPTKVQFVLKNTTDKHYITATGTAGNYYVSGTHAEESGATVLSPDSEGKLIVNGLEADTYELTEIKTAPGFSLLKQPVVIRLKPTVDDITPSAATWTGIANPNKDITIVNLDRASANVEGISSSMETVSTSENARVTFEVINNPGFNLPYTGGAGKTAVSLAGLLAIIGGLIAFRRRENEA